MSERASKRARERGGRERAPLLLLLLLLLLLPSPLLLLLLLSGVCMGFCLSVCIHIALPESVRVQTVQRRQRLGRTKMAMFARRNAIECAAASLRRLQRVFVERRALKLCCSSALVLALFLSLSLFLALARSLALTLAPAPALACSLARRALEQRGARSRAERRAGLRGRVTAERRTCCVAGAHALVGVGRRPAPSRC